MDYLIVLDSEMKRLFDVDTADVISPLVIEDSTTGENTFEFSFPVEDIDYLLSDGNILLIKDEDGDWQPYLIKSVILSVTGRGEQVLKVKCDHLFYELSEGLPQNHSYVNYTPAQALAASLADTRWQVGNIDASITDLVTISGSFYNPLRIVRQIESELAARVKFRATVGPTSITGLYVDIQEIDYEFSGQRFEFGYNLAGIDITVDSSRVYTALTGIVPGQLTDPVTDEAIPLTFADEVWTIAGGDPADKPVGQTWVGNEEARLLYGIGGTTVVSLDENFSTWSGWSDFLLGSVEQSSEQYRSAGYSLKKTSNGDPHGGFKLLDQTVSRDYTFEGWLYRPSGYNPSFFAERLYIADSNYDGYGFAVTHSVIYIERQTPSVRTIISSEVSHTRVDDVWYKFVFESNADDTFTLTIYDSDGNQTGTVTSNVDTTFSGVCDRVWIRGGYDYYVDDLSVTVAGEKMHRFGIYDSGAATTSEGLLDATWLIGTRYHFAPKVNIEASVADLSKVKFVNTITGACETFNNEKVRVGNICYVIAENHGLLAAVDVRIIRIERYLKEPTKTRVIFGDALFAGSDFLRELQDEVDSKTRRRAQAPDRGPGAAVTIASADTSLYPEYADIIVPAASENFEQYFHAAVDGLPAEGGQILILEGEYVYSDTMTIDIDNVTVTGQGEGTVIKLADDRLAETIGFQATGVSGTKIQDLTLYGNKDNQTEYSAGIDMSNVELHPGGNAWNNTETWWGDTAATNATIAWEFAPNQDLVVESIRTRLGVSRTYTVHIWDTTTSTAVATTTIANVTTGYTIKALSTPITILKDRKYRISFNYNNGETYGWRPTVYITPPSPGRDVDLAEFDDDLTVTVGAYYATAHSTYPTTFENPLFYGFIDFQISPKYGTGNTRWALKNVTVQDYSLHGILIQGGCEGEISNCRAIDNTSAGLYFVGSTSTGPLGSQAGPHSNVRVLGCDFRQNLLGIIGYDANKFLVQNNVLLENTDAGMIFVDSDDSSFLGNTCSQDSTTGGSLAGIAFLGCDNNTIGGNVSAQNAYYGIALRESDNNIVSNNVCNDSVYADGIYLANSSIYNTIQGNKCSGNTGYGINIVAGSNYNQVTNNDLYGNTAGGLLNGGTGTVTTAGNRT
jgi:phage minor structural protein